MAQFPNLVELSGQYMPGGDLPSTEGEVQVAAYDAGLNVPLVLAPTSFLILGAGYHADSVSFAEVPPGFVELRAFHSVELSLLFVQMLSEQWSLSFRLAPGLAGDFAELDGQMLRINGMAMASHVFSSSFTLGGGALVTYAFGEALVLPAIYADYRPLPQLRIEGFLPAFLSMKWIPIDWVEIGARAEFAGNQYTIRDPRVREAPPCSASDGQPRDPDACLDHFAYSEGSAGLTLGIRLFSDVWFEAYGGHTFFRRFEPKNSSSVTLPDLGDIQNGTLFRAGLAWRIPEGEEDE